MAVYFQDDWKPTPRLTLNLGLRWEMQTGPYSNTFQSVGKAALEAAGYNGELKNDKNNFGPRIGFAYDVKGDASHRGARRLRHATTTRSSRTSRSTRRWSDPATPLNFVSASPTPWTPAFFAANRDQIRNGFLDPTFAGQQVRLTAPDLVQPYAHHANAGFSVAPEPQRGLRRRLRLGRRPRRGAPLADQHSAEREHATSRRPASSLRSTARSSSRATAATRRSTASTSRARCARRSSTAIVTYAWSKAKNLGQRLRHPARRHHERGLRAGLGARRRTTSRHRVTAGLVYQLPWACQLSSGVPVQHRQALQRPRRPRRVCATPSGRSTRPRARCSPAQLVHRPRTS